MGGHDRSGAKHMAPALPLILIKGQRKRFAVGFAAEIRNVIHQRHMGGKFSRMGAGNVSQKVIITGHGSAIGEDGILGQGQLDAALVAALSGRELFRFY